MSDAELEHLHELYRNVRARGLELNTFELPRDLWRELLGDPCWELVLLRVPGRAEPVAVGAHFIGRAHYAPMIIGLDYDYLSSHHVYRQAMRQALLRARELGAERVLLGMGAPLEKQRFGARRQTRVAFAQASDHYSTEVLATLSAERREAPAPAPVERREAPAPAPVERREAPAPAPVVTAEPTEMAATAAAIEAAVASRTGAPPERRPA